tara:strand:- start:308 stop:751 length:444 start_codon:yes stop_codon:yes gene_type:complete
MPPKWDSPHQQYTIYNWKKRGLILREGETYKGIYSFYMNTDFCNKCNIKFNDEVHNEKKCMDHDHATRYFRQVLCHKCNIWHDRTLSKIRKGNKTGHRWIGIGKSQRDNQLPRFVFRYNRAGFKRKANKSLTMMIAYSFINLLKKPI